MEGETQFLLLCSNAVMRTASRRGEERRGEAHCVCAYLSLADDGGARGTRRRRYDPLLLLLLLKARRGESELEFGSMIRMRRERERRTQQQQRPGKQKTLLY